MVQGKAKYQLIQKTITAEPECMADFIFGLHSPLNLDI